MPNNANQYEAELKYYQLMANIPNSYIPFSGLPFSSGRFFRTFMDYHAGILLDVDSSLFIYTHQTGSINHLWFT